MHVRNFEIEGPLLLTPKRFEDHRGWFVESWNKSLYEKNGIQCDFIQDNMSLSRLKHTIRGLHYQVAPYAQSKLVSVLKGRIMDVVVDVREASNTYGRHISVTLDSETGDQLFVPSGFAHGFCTLSDNTQVSYKVDAPYAPDHEKGLLWSDADLGIQWPVKAEDAIISDKDRQLPTLKEL